VKRLRSGVVAIAALALSLGVCAGAGSTEQRKEFDFFVAGHAVQRVDSYANTSKYGRVLVYHEVTDVTFDAFCEDTIAVGRIRAGEPVLCDVSTDANPVFHRSDPVFGSITATNPLDPSLNCTATVHLKKAPRGGSAACSRMGRTSSRRQARRLPPTSS
jgi:hypothetical protein